MADEARTLALDARKLWDDMLCKKSHGTGGKSKGKSTRTASSRNKSRSKRKAANGAETSLERLPLILLTGETLHRVPWEAFPCAHGRTVTRMPSLPTILAHARHAEAAETATCDTGGTADAGVACAVRVGDGEARYILNPQGNLPKSQTRLEPVLHDTCGRSSAVVRPGSRPSAQQNTGNLAHTQELNNAPTT